MKKFVEFICMWIFLMFAVIMAAVAVGLSYLFILVIHMLTPLWLILVVVGLFGVLAFIIVRS